MKDMVLCFFFTAGYFLASAIQVSAVDADFIKRTKAKILQDYDKDVIPIRNGKPVDLSIGIYLHDMIPMQPGFMQFSFDIFLRMQWRDYRLAYNDSSVPFLPFDYGFYKNIWIPNLYFPRSKAGFKHTIILPNILVWLYSNGTISTSQRISLSTYCPMELLFYPFDIQTCESLLETYSYNADFVRVQWSNQSRVRHPQVLETTDFNNIEINTFERSMDYGPNFGNYTQIAIKFILHRNLGLYLLRDFFPCVLIVMLSWVSFWINYKSTPARVALGITTVLTVVTISNDVRDNSPEVGLFRSIDYYMLFCNLFVFAGLCEYALVGMTNPKLYKTQKCKEKSGKDISKGTPNDLFFTDNTNPTLKRVSYLPKDILFFDGSNQTTLTSVENTDISVPISQPPKDPRTSCGPIIFNESEAHFIDKISRVLFPVCFVILNICFYLYHHYHPDTIN